MAQFHRGSNGFTTVAVPVIASFVMVVWDLCFDPSFSTIAHRWVWDQGGGYFGVPLTNYLGWFLTVFLVYQLFALYIRFRAADRVEPALPPRAYAFQAVALYAAIGLSFVIQFLSASHAPVTDAMGRVWQTGDIYETAAIVSIFTMLFVAVVTTVNLVQGTPWRAKGQDDSQRAGSDVEVATPATPAR